MKTVAFLIILIFAVFGFSEFLHIVKMAILFPRKKNASRIVVQLQNDIAEKQMLYVCEQYKWYGKSYADSIILNTQNLDEENLQKCRILAKKYDVEI